jgi:hypothetical protein
VKRRWQFKVRCYYRNGRLAMEVGVADQSTLDLELKTARQPRTRAYGKIEVWEWVGPTGWGSWALKSTEEVPA